MAKKIALLLKQHFIDYCRPLLGEQWNECVLTYCPYETISELQDLFCRLKGQYDAFITSGSLPLNALKAVDKAPYALKYHFGIYLENTYRLLLSYSLERSHLSPQNIGIDYLEDSSTLREVLNNDRLPGLVAEFEQSISGLSGEELVEFEQRLVKRYLDQYHQGTLDFVVTNFYSVVEALKKEHIECYYSYPSQSSLMQTLELCKRDIALGEMRGNIAAVIRVSLSLPENITSNFQELTLLAIKGRIVEYCRRYHCEPIVKDDFSDVEIYVSKEQLQQMTDQYSVFELPVYLEEEAGFKGIVSIGVGNNLSAAKLNALQAKFYAQRLNQPACIYIDENNSVHSIPIHSKHDVPAVGVPKEYINEAANASHLSAETIYRVISAMQKNNSTELSSLDLIQTEGFSACTAARVLRALTNAGYAKIAGQKRIGNKGRPINIFQLTLPRAEDQCGDGHELKQ